MNKPLYRWLVVIFIAALALAACGGSQQATEPAAGEAGEDFPEPPAPYAGMTNPLAGESAAVTAGAEIFQNQCASCHGEDAKGDGPAAVSLNPKPADLADNQARMTDGYLFWRISEGGQMAPFNSAMPAWKGALTENQIWQVITYLRTLG
jgi:mono/diheme cytochrome c family protein